MQKKGTIAAFFPLLLKAGRGYCCHVPKAQPSLLNLLRKASILILASITLFMLSAKVYSDTAQAAVAPSTYDGADNYNPVEYGGHVKWSVIKNSKAANTDGTVESTIGKGCPGDTKPEMSLGYIIGITLASGLTAAMAMVAFTAVVLMITVYIFDGLRIACPPPHPDHPDLGAYWTHFGTKLDADKNTIPVSKIIFSYRPCLGFLVEDSAGAERFKGVSSGWKCAGLRFGQAGDTKSGEDYVAANNSASERYEWEGGKYDYVYGVFLGTKELEDKICLYMEAGISKVELLCQYKRPPPPPVVPQLACFMPKVCADSNAQDQSRTKLPFSISSTLVRCIDGTLSALFQSPIEGLDYYTPTGGTCNATSFMERFQLLMHRTVTGLLTLYIIFYGLKIAFGVQIPQRNEFFMRLITFAFVSYFALGTGWKDYFHSLLEITNSLSAMLMDSTTAGHRYCDFPSSIYEKGFEHNRLWDTLDCKIMTYFFSDTDYPKLLVVGFYSFFGGGILILIFGIIFSLFLILILTFTINVYIAAFTATTILAFLSPVFVPMALFGPTKQYFNAWLDEIIGFAIYPVILFAFISLMLVSFDVFMFNETVTKDASNKSLLFQNPKNDWLIAGTDRAVCSLRDRNPLILAEYASSESPNVTAMARCQADCWMYEAKLVDDTPNDSAVPDCSQLPSAKGPTPVIALCKTTGECMQGDYKPKFKAYCRALKRTFPTEAKCRKAEVCPAGVPAGDASCSHPCNENDCVPKCDPAGFGCQLYRARFGGPGAVAGYAVGRFEMGNALLALLKVLGVGILFFHFIAIIGPMIAQLTGNRKSSLQAVAINPHAVMAKIGGTIASAARSGASKAAGATKKAVKRD